LLCLNVEIYTLLLYICHTLKTYRKNVTWKLDCGNGYTETIFCYRQNYKEFLKSKSFDYSAHHFVNMKTRKILACIRQQLH